MKNVMNKTCNVFLNYFAKVLYPIHVIRVIIKFLRIVPNIAINIENI